MMEIRSRIAEKGNTYLNMTEAIDEMEKYLQKI